MITQSRKDKKYYCLNKKMVSLFSRYCIIFNRFNKGSEIVANKYIRKFRRLKKEGQNSTYMKNTKKVLEKRAAKLGIIVAVILIIVGALFFYKKYHKYTTYKVIESTNIKGGASSKYIPFGDYVIKYSYDGIAYIKDKETVWEEAYEMKQPIIDVCDDYVAIADKNTNDIFIYNDKGRQGQVSVSYPIVKLEVAKQGVVAALLEDKTSNYIEVYDKEGKQLVSHKSIIDENGYPINFSMSDDGERMAVSYLTVKNGSFENKIQFYDFSNSGKNIENRMVKEFSGYGETIVPTISYVSNSQVVAIGENIVSIYKVGNKDITKKDIKIKEEIQKVFYNDKYVGLVFKNASTDRPYRIEVYNSSGSQILNSTVDIDFENVTFAGDNILMYSDMRCEILSIKGVKKFQTNFKGQIYGLMPYDDSKTYLLMTNSKIQKIRLK